MSVSSAVVNWLLRGRVKSQLAPAILRVKAGGTASIVLESSTADSLNIVNPPGFATISETNKPGDTITVNLQDIYTVGFESFDVELIGSGRTTTISGGLIIAIAPDVSKFEYINTSLHLTTPPTIAVDDGSSVVYESPVQTLYKANGDQVVIVGYFPSYGGNSQMFAFDLATNALVNQEDTRFSADTIHVPEFIYLGDGKNLLMWYQGAFLRYNLFNTANLANPWSDLIPVDTVLQNASGSTVFSVQMTDGMVVVGSSSDKTTANGAVREIDWVNGTTKLYPSFPTDDGIGQVGGHGATTTDPEDKGFIYIGTNIYSGSGDIIAINRATDEITTLYSSVEPSYLHQRKHGVVVRAWNATTLVYDWFWLYNGAMLPTTDLNANPPWGADETDLYKDSLVTDLPSKAPEIDTVPLLPINETGETRLSYKPDAATDFIDILFTGVITYPSTKTSIKVLKNGDVIVYSQGYQGINIINGSTEEMKHYMLASGRPSLYALAERESDGKVAMGGYYGSPWLILDPLTLFTNRHMVGYNSNAGLPAVINPANKGAIGTLLDDNGVDVNVDKSFRAIYDSNGWLVGAGEAIRSNDGGGVYFYNHDTDELISVVGFVSEEARGLCSMGDYIIASSIGVDGLVKPLSLSVIDINTKKIIREIQPNTNILGNHGVLETDGEFLYLLTKNDTETETYLYKIDISKTIAEGAIVKSVTYPFKSSIAGYNDGGLATLEYKKDPKYGGFLYSMIGEGTFVRVDTTTLQAEPILRLSKGGKYSIGANNQIYFTDGYDVIKQPLPSITEGFVTLPAPIDIFESFTPYADSAPITHTVISPTEMLVVSDTVGGTIPHTTGGSGVVINTISGLSGIGVYNYTFELEVHSGSPYFKWSVIYDVANNDGIDWSFVGSTDAKQLRATYDVGIYNLAFVVNHPSEITRLANSFEALEGGTLDFSYTIRNMKMTFEA